MSIISAQRAVTIDTFPVKAVALLPAAPGRRQLTHGVRACVGLMKPATFSRANISSLCGGFLIVTSVEFINARPLCTVVISLSIWPQTASTLLPLATSQTHHMSIW